MTLPAIDAEDLQFGDSAPRPVDRLPDFDLTDVNGNRLRRDELARRPVLLVTGSFTCPMTASFNPKGLARSVRHGHRVRHALRP